MWQDRQNLRRNLNTWPRETSSVHPSIHSSLHLLSTPWDVMLPGSALLLLLLGLSSTACFELLAEEAAPRRARFSANSPSKYHTRTQWSVFRPGCFFFVYCDFNVYITIFLSSLDFWWNSLKPLLKLSNVICMVWDIFLARIATRVLFQSSKSCQWGLWASLRVRKNYFFQQMFPFILPQCWQYKWVFIN